MLYKQIILEWGQDTESGVWGLGYSPDNGKNFYVLNTTHGRKYRAEDGNRLYPYISDQVQDKIDTAVTPAKSAADSAYSMASQAVEQANVTKKAQAATDQAVTEAKQGANDAMSRAKSAWDVATGAKEAVTEFDPLLKQAQSDAVKALTQVADTASALSDAKTAFSSDVAENKKLANNAQTTADSAVKSAGENAKALTSQANALSDARKAMDSDIANAKELANAAQTTADSAVKSASSVADDLAAVASQTKANANGITKVTSDVGLLQTTVADNSGNISTIQETAKQIQQAVSDNAGNITVAKQTADSAVTVASDAKSNATVAVQTASGASVTAKNAQGDATTAMVTAKSAVTQASDAKSNATFAIQTASEASLTATNAQGDASIAKQTASEASVQIKNAQGDISKLQTRAGAIETSVANNSGAIADVQATANQLKASVSDNSGAIVVATQTAQSAATVASDAKSNATVAIQTASQASITAQNASGQAASAVITANGAMTTASNAQSDATVAIQTASGASLTAINANSDATIAKQTASEAKIQASNAESDFAQLSIRAGKIEASVANNSGAIASVQQTANGLTSRVGNLESKTSTQETEIKQNKEAIALKADQVDVNKINGTVSQLQSSLTVQAGQIQEKVTSSQVTGMLAGYATQDYTQSLVTTASNNWNLNLTSLKTDVDAIKANGGGVNLLTGTSGDLQTYSGSGWGSGNLSSTSLSLVPGQTYTAKLWIQGYDVPTRLVTRAYNGSGVLIAYAYGNTIGANSSGYSTVTWNADSNWASNVVATLSFTSSQSATHSGQYKELMIEEGTVAHTWSPAPSDMATVTSVTNLSATVDGIQSQVYNSDGSSKITQLSSLIAAKVSQGDYNSQITQLQNDINLRVAKGDVISQINQEAGGNTLIQVSNGKGSLILDAANTIITGEAWIPSAAIGSISADKVMLGSSALYNSDGTLNLVNQNNNLKALIQVKQGLVQDTTQSIISFSSDYNNRAFSITPVGATVTPTLFFERYDQTEGHWLGFTRNEVRRDGLMFHTWDDEGERFFVGCHARFDRNISANGAIYQGTWNGTNGKPLAGVLSIETGNTIWSGSDFLAIGDHLSNSFTNVMARSFSQQSTLSSKTNIETVDSKDALDLVNRTDIRSYQYKTDVAQGKTKRYTSLIIDDVNDVSQYYAPDEFTNEERTGRDDGSAVGYLFLAVQELTRRIKTLEEKLNG